MIRLVALLAIPAAGIWLVANPGFEPLLALLGAITTFALLPNHDDTGECAASESTEASLDDVSVAPLEGDDTVPCGEPSEAERLAARFREVFDRMNEGRSCYRVFTIAQLAKQMGLSSLSDLENVFLGEVVPTFDFMHHFCDTFGISEEWLAEGKCAPFSNTEGTKGYPLCYFEDIQRMNPSGIYFVRANTASARAFLVLKFHDLKFKTLPRIWHISDDVGAGGQMQLVGFYKLIRTLKREGYHMRCEGRTLKEDEFEKLLLGEDFPGKYFDCLYPSDQPWWDDLEDIDHAFPISKDYERLYGRSFIRAQEIIKWKLGQGSGENG